MQWSELEEFHVDMLVRIEEDISSVPYWLKDMCVDKSHAQALLNIIDEYMQDNKGMADLLDFYRDHGLETTPVELGVILVICHNQHNWDDEHVANILTGFCKIDKMDNPIGKEDNEGEEWKNA